jgi:VanZ family protein
MNAQASGKPGLLAALRKYRLATSLATAAVLIAILIPGDELPKVEAPGLDKVVHVLLFGCWALALRFDWNRLRAAPFLLLAAGAIFALATEFIQLFVPLRSFDLLDMAADVAGVALAAAFGGPAVALAERMLAEAHD